MKKLSVLLLVCAILLCLTGCKSSDYQSATAAMSSGNYASALTILESLGDYKDSAALAQECRYSLAVEDFKDGSYETAKSAFAALSGYKDSNDYVLRCDYSRGLDAYAAGEYEQALSILSMLDGYSDSEHYITEAKKAILNTKLIGQWESDEVDCAELLIATLNAQDPLLGEAATAANMTLTMGMQISFADENTCTVRMTMTNLDSFVDAFNSVFRLYLEKSIEASLAEEDLTMEDLYTEVGTKDIDEIYAQLFGGSLQDYIDSIGMQDYLEALMEEASFDGTYALKEDGTVSCNGDTLHYDAETDTLMITDDPSLEYLTGSSDLSFHRQAA